MELICALPFFLELLDILAIDNCFFSSIFHYTDNIFQNWIDSLTCEKISNMSQKELKHMNAEMARKVALQDASGKKA